MWDGESEVKYFIDFYLFVIEFLILWRLFFVGIEAEAVMLGQSISMLLPQVIGYKIYGKLSQYATSTDLVLTVTKVGVTV